MKGMRPLMILFALGACCSENVNMGSSIDEWQAAYQGAETSDAKRRICADLRKEGIFAVGSDLKPLEQIFGQDFRVVQEFSPDEAGRAVVYVERPRPAITHAKSPQVPKGPGPDVGAVGMHYVIKFNRKRSIVSISNYEEYK